MALSGTAIVVSGDLVSSYMSGQSANAIIPTGASSGQVLNCSCASGGLIYQVDGASSKLIISGGGYLLVSNVTQTGTVLTQDVDVSGGAVHVRAGAQLSSFQVFSGGQVFVSSGGTAVSGSVKAAGAANIYNGGTGINLTGITDSGIRVSSGGVLHISSGFTTGKAVFTGGVGSVYSGAVLQSSYITNDPVVRIWGRGETITISNMSGVGSTVVHSGGTGQQITVAAGGKLYLVGGQLLSSYISGTDAYVMFYQSSYSYMSNCSCVAGGALYQRGGQAQNIAVADGTFYMTKMADSTLGTLSGFTLSGGSAVISAGNVG